MHIQPVGSGASAIKYLGAYLARTAISDSRIVKLVCRLGQNDDPHGARAR